MNWVSSNDLSYTPGTGSAGGPNRSEVLKLVDDSGVVVGQFARTLGGAYTFQSGASIGTAGAGVTATLQQMGGFITLDLSFNNLLVTLVKNGTTSGGGGTTLFTFSLGIVQPLGGSSNLTVRNALDKSFLAGIGSAASGTDGSLTGTEISFLPQTAATTSSGAGTCKMKATVTTPTPGTKLDGTSTAVAVILNACLNADATGAESLFFSGTIRINAVFDGTN